MIRPVSLYRLIFLATLIEFVLIPARTVLAHFESDQWKFMRSISIADSVEGGLFGIALYADLLAHCRPDLKDIRIARSDERQVPSLVRNVPLSRGSRNVPVEIRLMNTVSGRWTDILIDKCSKVHTTGVRVDTEARNFVRRIEIRGWDEESENYVVRLDGLIAHVTAPFPIKTLDVFHPSNTFRYLNVRIHEDGQGPLKLDRVTCYGSDGEMNSLNQMKARVVESSSGNPSGTSSVVFDLGERRLPLVRVSIASGNSEFAKKVFLWGTSEKENAAWTSVYEGIFFRIRKGASHAEQMKADMPYQLFRYYKLELSGDGPEVPLEGIDCFGQVPVLIFHHEPGAKYYLYYGNAEQVQSSDRTNMESPGLRTALLDSSEVSWGPEERNPLWKPIVQETGHQGKSDSVTFAKIGLITGVLGLLVVVFLGMLKKGPLAKKR